MNAKQIFLLVLVHRQAESQENKLKYNEIRYNELDEHTLVTENGVFPYVVAILKKSSYISAGALIDENWVLTAADALFLIRESSRIIRVRLGSINYKKDGLLLPIKYFEIHPNFDDSKPIFDLALIRLAVTVRFTPNIKPITMQRTVKEAEATHYVVTSWSIPLFYSDESSHLTSMEIIKRRRNLSITHLHPIDYEECGEELRGLGINSTDAGTAICLDTGVMMDPCVRDVGAPVVLNGMLVAIVSSWRPAGCEDDIAGPSFATLVSPYNISTWIHSNIHDHKLNVDRSRK